MAQTTHINIGDGNAHSGNIISSFNVYKSDEDAQILRWLSPLEPNNRHQGVRNERFDGVGDWLLETKEFQEWMCSEGGADGAVLLCSGNPGVGKTYLSSLVIDSLCDQAAEGGIVVAGLYCDFLAQQEQTVTNMMGAILKQLAGRSDIPNYLREAFHKGKMEFGGRRMQLPDLMGMLKIAIASLPQVFICIDALDECLPRHLPELLKSLRAIVQGSPRTRIFLTGRPHIKEDIWRYFAKAVVIPISPNTDDIRSYLKMRLDGDVDPEAMNEDLRADITGVIMEQISDIFLLVSLSVDAILTEVTIHQRRKKLAEMTRGNGLSDAYTATLTRLKAQKGNKSALALRVLMWVLYSERPLRAEELCHALGVEVGSTDLNVENVPALRTLLASCLGLVTVEVSSSTVRLVHYTLQEHLLGDPTLFLGPHSTIAEVCLTYLNFGSVRDLSPALPSAPATTPLLEYASLFWGEHTRRGMTENVKTLALRLLDRFDEHISAQLMLLHYNRDVCPEPYFKGGEGPRGFTGLHGAAFLGIVGLVAAVLEMKEWDVNASDSTGSTALTWASGGGYEEVVMVLLDREDVNPNQADTWSGQTPLSWATERGYEGVVKILLERGDVNPNQPDTDYGRTPLSRASEYGDEGIVRMLLERGDVNPDQPDTEYGRTPLSWAAEGGHEGVVKMLLERGDVNPDQVDGYFVQTPLLWAAKYGREGVVKMLLERGDVNPNQADPSYGRTPLSWAAERGYEGVVKMLLECEDINPNQADTYYGQTPLSWASERGYEGIVGLLLERGDVNSDQPDTKYGRTPLFLAVQHIHSGVVRMLLERGNVNPNRPDTYNGQTPLSVAAEHGFGGVVKILLDREDVNPDQADTNSGRTPLSRAAQCGNQRVVEMLLERGDVNPDQPDTNYGRTPLSWAAERGREGVVKILLERGDVNPDRADTYYGQTPLSWAASRGNEGVVKMLLERGDVNPNQADTYGQTPLSYAAELGCDWVVRIFLERGDVNPNQADTKYGRTPLLLAAMYGHEDVVKVLLERKDVTAATLDSESQTPLSMALSKGHDRVVRMLLERDSVNSDTPDPVGRVSTPAPAGHGDECAVGMQSGGGDLKANITDINGQHALLSADLDERESVSDLRNLPSNSADRDLPSTEQPRPSQPPSMWSLGFWYPHRKVDTHPNNTPSILSLTVDRYFAIASFVCFLAFLVYIVPFSLHQMFPLHK